MKLKLEADITFEAEDLDEGLEKLSEYFFDTKKYGVDSKFEFTGEMRLNIFLTGKEE